MDEKEALEKELEGKVEELVVAEEEGELSVGDFSVDDQQYELDDQKEVVVDLENKKVEDLDDIPPFEKIKLAAEKYNIVLNDPNPNCKSCYGRGYTGINVVDNMPVACVAKRCVFPDESKKSKGNVPVEYLTGKTKRLVEKQQRKQIKKLKQNKTILNSEDVDEQERTD